ncbi:MULTISPECIES: aromatic-ring-hydroxylating dioxygenase subunit beta [unclassified Pseudonocardia]|uniref:aromatic-ring-hydroxylating dioxygenase subunit beta n=1 Tax=unclassified Pseudonocardia TaxID=2619320 RepID=UPI00095CEDE5|nr:MULTISPECIES: aromatic-ring-hydroxylating dioxygenase subunit beta [unclassified Pseudonocardia]MBN9097525.1 aromatic-ring-hydroxylating dioxygenase subunit beta [Pseudonocardia sp.]OJY39849.1 MAG: aromatic-ring-hydroxylating dioxygenase subunit beta [Pseudonocardia sp. 73-21]
MITRAEVEDFLYREAELLDDWDLDGWLALWTDDARYVVPCNDAPDGDPSRDLVLIDDNALRLASRVERLNSRKAHREYPHSTTSHQVSNVRLRAMEGDELPVVAEFTVWRFRGERSTTYVGRSTYRLRIVDGELRIRSKRAVLAMGSLRQVADVAIIL